MSATPVPGFFVLPFAIDGKSVGVGFWETSRLSDDWLKACGGLIGADECSVNQTLGGTLSHIRVRFTCASGAALSTVIVADRVASSAILLSGRSPDPEHEAVDMFIESLKRIELVKRANASLDAFAELRSVQERPLLAIVAWADPKLSEGDQELAQELALHLAGSYFDRSLSS